MSELVTHLSTNVFRNLKDKGDQKDKKFIVQCLGWLPDPTKENLITV